MGRRWYQTALQCYRKKSFVKGWVDWCSKLHFCLILRNCHSHPRLRQPPPWSVSSHQHGRKTLQQQRHYLLLKDITTCWKFWWWLAFFSNKVFLYKVCTFFFQTEFGCTLNRLQYNVNRTFIWTGKPKHSCPSLCCPGLELNPLYLQSMPILI